MLQRVIGVPLKTPGPRYNRYILTPYCLINTLGVSNCITRQTLALRVAPQYLQQYQNPCTANTLNDQMIKGATLLWGVLWLQGFHGPFNWCVFGGGGGWSWTATT